MKGIDATAICIVICGTAGYVTYVTITHADGLAFGGFCAFLGSVGGYAYAKR